MGQIFLAFLPVPIYNSRNTQELVKYLNSSWGTFCSIDSYFSWICMYVNLDEIFIWLKEMTGKKNKLTILGIDFKNYQGQVDTTGTDMIRDVKGV